MEMYLSMIHLIVIDIEMTRKGEGFAENQRIIERFVVAGPQALISQL